MQGIPEAQNMKKGKYWREYHFVFDLLPHSLRSIYVLAIPPGRAGGLGLTQYHLCYAHRPS